MASGVSRAHKVSTEIVALHFASVNKIRYELPVCPQGGCFLYTGLPTEYKSKTILFKNYFLSDKLHKFIYTMNHWIIYPDDNDVWYNYNFIHKSLSLWSLKVFWWIISPGTLIFVTISLLNFAAYHYNCKVHVKNPVLLCWSHL